MILTLLSRPSSYAAGRVEVLEDLISYTSRQAGGGGWDSNTDVLLDATAFADYPAIGLAHKRLLWPKQVRSCAAVAVGVGCIATRLEILCFGCSLESL